LNELSDEEVKALLAIKKSLTVEQRPE